MPHSPESDEVIRWIVDQAGSGEVAKNHIDDLLVRGRGDRPALKTVGHEFTLLRVSAQIRLSARNSNPVVRLSGTNTELIHEVKDFFARHKTTFEFRD